MIARARLVSSVVFFGVALCSPRVFANDTNYQNFVTGGRAVGLGGAFTALANDPSGLLFNPAGIVDDRHTDVSLSANLYGFDRSQRGDRPPSPIPDPRNLAQAATELVIVPSTSGAIRTFQKDPDGDGYLNAVGFAVLVPSYRETTDSQRTQGDDGSLADYRRSIRDRMIMPGAGYARKLGAFRVGVSTFFQLRTIDSQENITSQKPGAPTPFRFADSTVNLSAGSLLWVLGGKWLVSDALSLGLSLALPSLPVFSSASVRYYRGAFDPSDAPQGSFRQVVEPALSSAFASPAVLRFGTAYVMPHVLTISADVSLNFPTAYELLKAPAGVNLTGILPFVSHVTRNAVVNLNVGAEWLFKPTMSIAAGFYTDFASSPSLSSAAYAGALSAQYLSNIDYYGFTAAYGIYSANTLTRIGAIYSFGHGRDVVSRDDFGRLLSDGTQFQRVSLSVSSLYLFVSSTVRFD